jgi:hypothetical protein
MRLLTRDDIYPQETYEHIRPDFRRRIMVQKDKRRVAVGDHCSIHFENRDTVLYQIMEMLRAERSWDRPGAVEAELAAYNPLIPQTGELSATMMLEYETEAERREILQQLVGIEEHVWLRIGETPPLKARFDVRQLDETKVSSVQYLKWHLNEGQCRLLKQDGTVVRVIIDHPYYEAQAVLSEETRRAIMHDPDSGVENDTVGNR